MDDFKLVQSFGIDNGELDGMTPQECFVLGYELCHIHDVLARGYGHEGPVHAANRERIEDACDKAEAEYILTWMPNDTSETWMLLRIGSKLSDL